MVYLKSLSIIDVDLAHLKEAHASQIIIFVYIFEYPFFLFFVRAHLSDDVVSCFAMHVVAFRLLLCIVLDHRLVLGK